MKKKYKNILLSILSGFLFTIGWPTYGIPFFLFFAFVPLFFIEEDFLLKRNKKHFFLLIYLAFFLWNFFKTWWIAKASLVGGVFAVVVNSLLMTLVFWVFHFVRKRLPDQMALPFFVFVWIAFEKFHLNWDFSWPWLHLGNGFSEYPQWIQWYEYTGYFGGSLWILLVNIMIYKTISNHLKNKIFLQTGKLLIKSTLLILIPLIISYYINKNYIEKGTAYNVLIAQPNFDPWEEKFMYSNLQLAQDLLSLAKNKKADLLVAPETALSQYTEIETFSLTKPYQLLSEYASSNHINILTGVDFIHWYEKTDTLIPVTANKTKNGRSYNMYNSAVFITPEHNYQIYHKSKLVVGAEYTPFSNILIPLIGDWVIKTIGISLGSNISQEDVSVFENKKLKVAPIICYESVYGEYVTKYVRKGANLLAVITNDGWWGNTEGHRQHISIARIRAIENRRDLVQSANTGISAHINQKGEILDSLSYEKRGVLQVKVLLNNQTSFYTKHGDYIARVSIFMAILLFIYAISQRKKFLNN